jgi:hypothetical protein
MDKLKNEEIIKNFLKQMSLQNNRGTAAPYFYVIMTEVDQVVPIGYADETYWYDPENPDCAYDDVDSAIQEYQKEGFSRREITDMANRLEEYGIRKRFEPRGMFLTEDDAQTHLESNHYHYSDNAHTYVDHAWRAPKLAEFLKALFEEYGIDMVNYKL